MGGNDRKTNVLANITTLLILLSLLMTLLPCSCTGEHLNQEKSTLSKGVEMTSRNSKTEEILVKFRPGVPQTRREEISLSAGLESVRIVSPPDLYLFRIPKDVRISDVKDRLQTVPEVEYAEPNYIRKTE